MLCLTIGMLKYSDALQKNIIETWAGSEISTPYFTSGKFNFSHEGQPKEGMITPLSVILLTMSLYCLFFIIAVPFHGTIRKLTLGLTTLV